MEKRGEHWTSRLGEALREEKGAGASEYLQPTFHLAPGTQWRKGNLSLSQTWPLHFSCCQAFCSQKKGLSRNVEGGSGGVGFSDGFQGQRHPQSVSGQITACSLGLLCVFFTLFHSVLCIVAYLQLSISLFQLSVALYKKMF